MNATQHQKKVFNVANLEEVHRTLINQLHDPKCQRHHQYPSQVNECVVYGLKKKYGKHWWQHLYQQFYQTVKQTMYSKNLFIQEHPQSRCCMVTFLGHIVQHLNPQQIRDEQLNYGNSNYHYVLFDLFRGRTVNFQQVRPIQYGWNEAEEAVNFMGSLSNLGDILVTFVPIGIQLTASFVNDKWNLNTKTAIRLNESKFIGQVTLEQKLEELLQRHNMNLNMLDKKVNYKFYLSSQQYSVLPVADQVYYLGCYCDKRQKHVMCDELKLQLEQLPQLKKTSIVSYPGLQYLIQAVEQYDPEYPISSMQFTITSNNGKKNSRVYTYVVEVTTDVQELLNDARRENKTLEAQQEKLDILLTNEYKTSSYANYLAKQTEQ